MKHDEMAVAPAGKSSVGLSVATLAKLLHAPKLKYPHELHEDDEEDIPIASNELVR